MSGKTDSGEFGDSPTRERRHYVVGYLLALLLTLLAFGLVAIGALPRGATLAIIALAGIAQLIVQFRYFLHIDLKQSHRDDLQLILFTGLLAAIMVGGTIWILYNQMAMMG